MRNLERELGKLLRKTAARVASGDATPPVAIDEDAIVRPRSAVPKFFAEVAERTSTPGVATGLAVTGAGGDVLFIEATTMDGEGLTLTGQLGDVMKESAQIALSYVQAHADRARHRARPRRSGAFHVHVPAGSDPQGRSVGRHHDDHRAGEPAHRARRCAAGVGMTGEVTLQGRVLPIGGVKQKVLAAQRAGLDTVILPKRNGPDLDDVPEAVRDVMTFHLVDDVRDVFALALEGDEAEESRAA